MAQDYTAWPAHADVTAELGIGGITVRAGVTSGYITATIDAVVRNLQQRTRRQFLKGSAGEVRYFDGSGSGEQTVDDYVDITSVDVIGYLGGISGTLGNWYEPETALYPKNIIVIFQGSLPAVGRIWLESFPGGRRNIKVTGQWGYGTYIPDDVWYAVRGMAAAIIADKSVYKQEGRLEKWIEADVSEQRKIGLPSELTGWADQFKLVIFNYRKSLQTHLRKSRKSMT